MTNNNTHPIWVKIEEDNEFGQYVNASGKRFNIQSCVAIYHPQQLTPEQLGWERYDSEQAALEANELTPYVDPEAQEEMEAMKLTEVETVKK